MRLGILGLAATVAALAVAILDVTLTSLQHEWWLRLPGYGAFVATLILAAYLVTLGLNRRDRYDKSLADLIEARYPKWFGSKNMGDVGVLVREVRQEAINGALTLWGRGGQNFDLYPLVKIPPAEWVQLNINLFDVMRGKPSAEPLNSISEVRPYYDLWANSAEFYALWAKRRWWHRFSAKGRRVAD